MRIVAATHRDLPGMVEKQTFREDLYYRLSVFPIVIPPLRDRPSDTALRRVFAERAANRFGLRPVPVSGDDVRRLAEYQWPGNVREMAAVMDRAVLIGQGKTLSVAGALGQDSLTASTAPARPTDQPSARIAPLDVVIRAHRSRARGDQRPSRGPAWGGSPAADQSSYAARPHAQIEHRLAGLPPAR